MKLTLTQFIKDTELNDFKVNDIRLNVAARQFKVNLEGAYWFENGSSKPIILEKGGLITINNYSSFEAKYFSPEDNLWRTLDYESLEIIDEINEKSYDGEVLKLAGIGKNSGYWIEYLIKSGDCEICFNE